MFDLGDPITSRLALGVTPDGTTTVTVAWTKPDGTEATPATQAGPTGDEYSSQITSADMAGDWLAVWTVTGTGAGVQAKIYNVRALPSASDTRPAWAPFLSDVADHVPYLTVDTVTPGSVIHLGTFTPTTTPTDEPAQRHVDAAVRSVAAAVGTLNEDLYGMGRNVAALRAAASIARAYPRDDGDLQTAAALDARADAELTRLKSANDAAGGGSGAEVHLLPVWAFPDSVPWGDSYL